MCEDIYRLATASSDTSGDVMFVSHIVPGLVIVVVSIRTCGFVSSSLSMRSASSGHRNRLR